MVVRVCVWREARFFFDTAQQRFETTCLPSQLNQPQRRAKERAKTQEVALREEAWERAPSLVWCEKWRGA